MIQEYILARDASGEPIATVRIIDRLFNDWEKMFYDSSAFNQLEGYFQKHYINPRTDFQPFAASVGGPILEENLIFKEMVRHISDSFNLLPEDTFNSWGAVLYEKPTDYLFMHHDHTKKDATDPHPGDITTIAIVGVGIPRTLRFWESSKEYPVEHWPILDLSVGYGTTVLMQGQTNSLFQHSVLPGEQEGRRIGFSFRKITE